MSNKLILFESKEIRRFWDEPTERWYFIVVDVIEVLTDSPRPSKYWTDLKKRVLKQSKIELSALCGKFPIMNSKNGRTYQMECADTEGLLRIIQSVPSQKAEPFKQWLAQVGYERIQEIEDPELIAERMRQTYLAKGYDPEWVEKRLQSIAIRKELTNEWDDRGVVAGQEYAILTSEISKATFGVTPKLHKEIKGLKRQNLRDHMTPLELVFTMLGEASTTEIAREEDAQGFDQNRSAAKLGGSIAGNARKELEAETGKPVVNNTNFLPEKKTKKLKDKNDQSE